MNDYLHLVGKRVTIRTKKPTSKIPGNTIFKNVLVVDCNKVYGGMACYERCKKIRLILNGEDDYDNLGWCLDENGRNGGYEILSEEEFVIREDGSFCYSSR